VHHGSLIDSRGRDSNTVIIKSSRIVEAKKPSL
jgi:hypothetical protein